MYTEVSINIDIYIDSAQAEYCFICLRVLVAGRGAEIKLLRCLHSLGLVVLANVLQLNPMHICKCPIAHSGSVSEQIHVHRTAAQELVLSVDRSAVLYWKS